MCKEKSEIGFSMGLITGVIGGIIAGVLFAPEEGKKTRQKLKDTACELAEKHSPAINEAKKQALESIDLLKYKLEQQYKKFNNMLKNRKMRKAKELESTNEYDFN